MMTRTDANNNEQRFISYFFLAVIAIYTAITNNSGNTLTVSRSNTALMQ